MKKSNQKNSVERIIKDPTYTIYSKGGVAKKKMGGAMKKKGYAKGGVAKMKRGGAAKKK